MIRVSTVLTGLIARARAPLVVLGLARGAASLLGLVSTSLVAAWLGPAALGTWALALNLQGWVQHLAELGLRSAVTAEAARTGEPGPLVLPYVAARLACTLVAAGGTWLIARWTAPDIAPVLGLVLLALVPMALQLDWVALVDGRPLAAALPLVLRPAAFLLGIAIWPGELDAVAVALLFVLSWIASAASTWTGLQGVDRAPHGTTEKLMRAGPPLALNNLLNQALLGLDLWVVAHVSGTATAGCYHLAAQLATAGLVTANAAGQLTLARRAGSAAEEGRALVALAWIGAGQGALLTAAGPLLVPALFGSDFAQTAALLGPFGLWIAAQHLSAPLQSARAVAGDRRSLAVAGAVALATTLAMLALAAWLGRVDLAAWSRPVAELVRAALLLRAVAPATWRPARDALVPLVLMSALAAAVTLR